jgi:hypothetical protein
LKRAGLEGEGFTFHTLRHTFASALCNKREHPKVIQFLLGHSSITQTMDTLDVKCPSCDQTLAATEEGGLMNVLREHLYEEHALEMPPERVRENVAAQLREFDGYSARPISGA